jgi:hypothetical protein
MDKKGATSSIFLYIILIVIGAVIILVVLQVFTPYKLSDLFTTLITKATSQSVV